MKLKMIHNTRFLTIITWLTPPTHFLLLHGPRCSLLRLESDLHQCVGVAQLLAYTLTHMFKRLMKSISTEKYLNKPFLLLYFFLFWHFYRGQCIRPTFYRLLVALFQEWLRGSCDFCIVLRTIRLNTKEDHPLLFE